MVSSLGGSNASIPELVKMTHIIDKLLSADSTVPTEIYRCVSLILYLCNIFISHTPLCFPTSAARYLISKILTITAGINQQSMLNLSVKAMAENIAHQKFCGRMNLS